MNLFYYSLAPIFALFILIFSIPVFAQVEEVVTTSTPAVNEPLILSTLNIQDAKILSQKGNVFELYFNFVNKEIIQSGVKYGVKLIQETETGQFVVDEKVYPEILTIPENSIEGKIIAYTAPENISGKYTILITAQNEKGFSLGFTFVDTIELNATSKEVEIVPSSCYLKVVGEENGAKYNIAQAVDINFDETLSLNCLVKNPSDSSVSVNAFFNTFRSTIYGEPVVQIGEDTSMINFMANEEKEIFITLPRVVLPQIYETKVSLSSITGSSNSVVVRYILRGPSATINNIWLDKNSYQSGEVANASLMWESSTYNYSSRLGTSTETVVPAISLDLTLLDSDGKQCSETINKVLDQNDEALKVKIPIAVTQNCANPIVSATLKDEQGNVFDKFGFVAKEESINPVATVCDSENTDCLGKSDNKNVYIITIVIALIILIPLIVFLRKLKLKVVENDSNHNITKTFIFAFLFIFGGIMMPVDVDAVNFCANQTGPPVNGFSRACNPISVNIDKSSYVASSPMTVSISTGVSPTYGDLVYRYLVQGSFIGVTPYHMANSYDSYNGWSMQNYSDTTRYTGFSTGYATLLDTPHSSYVPNYKNIIVSVPSSAGLYVVGARAESWWDSSRPSHWYSYQSNYGDRQIAFTVTGALPPAPTSATINLSKNNILATESLTVSWAGNNSPTYYRVKVGTTEYDRGSDTTWTGTPASLGLGVKNHNFYAMACNTTGCSPWSPVKILTVIASTPAPTLTFTASPSSVTVGSASNLTWSTTNATACTASGDWSGSKTASGLPIVSTGVLNTVKTYTYTLKCTGAGGEVTKSATVIVSSGAPVPTLTFTANPTSVAVGGSSNLTWSATDVTTCIASGDWSGSKSLSGVQSTGVLNTVKTYTYTLRCIAGGGDIIRTVTVTVGSPSPPPPLLTGTIDANNCLVTVPGTRTCDTVVSWNATGYPNPKVYKSGSPWLSLDLPADIINSRSASVHLGGVSFVLQDSSVGPIDSVIARANCGPGLTYTYVASTGIDTCEAAVSSPYIRICPDNATVAVGGRLEYEVRYWSDSSVAPTCSTGSYAVVSDPGIGPINPYVAIIDVDPPLFKPIAQGVHVGVTQIYADYTPPSKPTLNTITNLTVADSSLPDPVISLIAKPQLVRNGNTTDIESVITSAYPTTCTLYGVHSSPIVINHTGTPSTKTYTKTTIPLEGAQIVSMDCVVDADSSATASESLRINLVPSIEEI